MVERHVRLDRDGAAQMTDRFRGLARLVRDNALHVRDLGIVRLGRGRPARQIVGIGQEAMAALLLGKDESLTGRHRLRRRRNRGCGARGFRRHDRGRLHGAALALGLVRRQPRGVALRDGF
jgi:hypothetical protein